MRARNLHSAAIGSAFLVLTAATGLGGCRSVRGKYVDPRQVRHGEDVGGVPIVVERPRWLKVTEKTTTYAVYATETQTRTTTSAAPAETAVADAGAPEPAGAKPPKVPNPAAGEKVVETKVRSVNTFERTSYETDVVRVGEVYALDMLRPFSGTSDQGLEMLDDKGHLKSYRNKLDDTTMKDVLENLPGIQSFITGFAGQKPATDTSGDVKVVALGERVSRIQFFDLEDLANGVYRPVLVLPSPNGLCAPPCPTPDCRPR